ncbi:DUF397 domain-containing protein [Streptomyces sp. SM18]|uniref:DUF397 domain-containing protein n=1 Tax=Streptomyces sp. SM18 TaxID=1736046 RepID=UPI0035C6BAC2
MTLGFRPGLGAVAWRRSSYSNTQGGDCVEVADGLPSVLPVRDSKRPTDRCSCSGCRPGLLSSTR